MFRASFAIQALSWAGVSWAYLVEFSLSSTLTPEVVVPAACIIWSTQATCLVVGLAVKSKCLPRRPSRHVTTSAVATLYDVIALQSKRHMTLRVTSIVAVDRWAMRFIFCVLTTILLEGTSCVLHGVARVIRSLKHTAWQHIDELLSARYLQRLPALFQSRIDFQGQTKTTSKTPGALCCAGHLFNLIRLSCSYLCSSSSYLWPDYNQRIQFNSLKCCKRLHWIAVQYKHGRFECTAHPPSQSAS